MTLLAHWLLLTSINLAAVISPGPAFAMTVRNAIAYNRRAGIFTALGLGAGVGVIVALVLCGFAAVISQSVLLFNLIKYCGAAYLIYIGVKALFARKAVHVVESDSEPQIAVSRTLSDFNAFRMGLITNLCNPKGIVFFTAVYAQFILPHTPLEVMVLYNATAIVLEAGWFSLVTIVLTNPLIKNKFMNAAHWVERLCGGLMVALGVRLAFSKI